MVGNRFLGGVLISEKSTDASGQLGLLHQAVRCAGCVRAEALTAQLEGRESCWEN